MKKTCNNANLNKQKNIPEPFIAPYSNTPVTQEEIEKRLTKMKRAEEIGASITKVTDEGYENPYRVKALVYINKNQEVPDKLKKKIKEFDEHYKNKSNKK